MGRIGPSLKYPGAKWGSHNTTAAWICSHLPHHDRYVEPFFGSGGVFFNKCRARLEYINDINGDVVNLFRVLREQPDTLIRLVNLTPYARQEYVLALERVSDPVERARRTLIRHWMSYGGDGGVRGSGWRHSGVKNQSGKVVTGEWGNLPERLVAHARRLKNAHIENRPALELLGRLNHETVLAYIDPPYLGATRNGKLYHDEMQTEDQHIELLDFLSQDWRGAAVVSGYVHPLYDDLLQGWTRVTKNVAAEQGGSRTEALWLNPMAVAGGMFP